MTKTSATTGTPGVTREFVGMDSPTARRAGAGGHPCQGSTTVVWGASQRSR